MSAAHFVVRCSLVPALQAAHKAVKGYSSSRLRRETVTLVLLRRRENVLYRGKCLLKMIRRAASGDVLPHIGKEGGRQAGRQTGLEGGRRMGTGVLPETDKGVGGKITKGRHRQKECVSTLYHHN